MHGMAGMKVLAAGILVALLGGGFFGGYHFFELAEQYYKIGIALLVLGAIGFLSGLGLLVYALRDPMGVHAQDANASFMALLRCMVAMSIADGQLDDEEIEGIVEVYETLTENELEPETVIEIAESMMGEELVLRKELENMRVVLTTDLKEKIVRASFYILAADGVVSAREKELLKEIRTGVGLSKARYLFLKREFIYEMKKMKQGA